MAVPRTWEEKMDILNHCLELERTGGDILGYLWSQDYITPRATWCNFQREFLHRKPYEFTDGKPGKPKKRRKTMSNNRLVITEDQKLQAVELAINGGSPCTYLKSLGCKNPSGAWHNIKSLMERTRPDVYAKIPKRTPQQELKLEAGANYEVSVKDAMDNIQGAVDEFFGKCEDMGLKVSAQQEEGVELEISAVRHRNYGEFYRDHDHNCIDWRTPEGDEMSLGINGWKNLVDDLPAILRCLGVEV